ncbi:MAG: M20/M25/M40 family metallo-hydrolase [Anaerolineae bacterium]|nr:M20/M25/M40 family metallo-hydrolase [Anaerolineae bacterium]
MASTDTLSSLAAIYQQPAELLRRLIQFDTTNPPGNEAACIAYLNGLLTEAGFETRAYARDPARPNLVTRLPGRGDAPPLLLYGHVDVVTTAGQAWDHPPFEARVADGFIWGRGALDMKNGVAMMVAALLRARAEGLSPPGDVTLMLLSDEENGSDYGAGFLVREHPELFAGIRYAIGEVGGASTWVSGRKFYPIQVAEKQVCWLRARLRGPGGHGAMPVRGGIMARLARFLDALDRQRLPVHVTPPARHMFETMAAALPDAEGAALRRLLDPAQTDAVLDELGPRGRLFDAQLHNTVAATIIRAGNKVNVIPGEVEVEMDGRLLPGYGPDDMMAELRALVGDDAALEVYRYDPGPTTPDMGLFETLAGVLREMDPDGMPVPDLLAGVTDGRFLAQVGIQSYGFVPMDLPPDFNRKALVHAANERVPYDAIAWGTEAIYRLLGRFGEAP